MVRDGGCRNPRPYLYLWGGTCRCNVGCCMFMLRWLSCVTKQLQTLLGVSMRRPLYMAKKTSKTEGRDWSGWLLKQAVISFFTRSLGRWCRLAYFSGWRTSTNLKLNSFMSLMILIFYVIYIHIFSHLCLDHLSTHYELLSSCSFKHQHFSRSSAWKQRCSWRRIDVYCTVYINSWMHI